MNSAYHSLREQLEGLLAESRLQSRQASEWEKSGDILADR